MEQENRAVKANLEPIEKIKAAYWYHVGGMTQTQICMALNVSNMGRVNEAIKHIEQAVGLSEGGYKDNHVSSR